jgi:hypothetical protein
MSLRVEVDETHNIFLVQERYLTPGNSELTVARIHLTNVQSLVDALVDAHNTVKMLEAGAWTEPSLGWPVKHPVG